MEPKHLTLEGKVLTTEPPGKSSTTFHLNWKHYLKLCLESKPFCLLECASFPLWNCPSLVESLLVKMKSQLSLVRTVTTVWGERHTLPLSSHTWSFALIFCSCLWSIVLRGSLIICPIQMRGTDRTLSTIKTLDLILPKFSFFDKTARVRLTTTIQIHIQCQDWSMPSLNKSWQ